MESLYGSGSGDHFGQGTPKVFQIYDFFLIPKSKNQAENASFSFFFQWGWAATESHFAIFNLNLPSPIFCSCFNQLIVEIMFYRI